MKKLALSLLAACCLPMLAQAQAQAQAQASSAPGPVVASEVGAEIKRLQAQLQALQQRLQELETKPAVLPPEQQRQLNRTTVRAEALEEAQEALGYKGLKISGLIDPSYIHVQGQNRSGFQFLNSGANFEYAYDNGAFGMAMLDFQKELEGGTKMRLTLAPNRGGLGIAIDGQSIVHEASLSIPVGDLQTRFIAGQIPDWSGHEFMHANQNRLVTHNLLFDFTIPAGYTGAGVEMLRNPWYVKALLANVSSSKKANGQKTPALAYRVDFFDYKREFNGFGFAGLHGKLPNSRAGDEFGNPVTGLPYSQNNTMVHSFEVDGFFSRGDWTISGQVGAGMQKRAAITADPVSGELRDARWWGVSTMLAYKWNPRLELIARLDYLNNSKHGGGTLGYAFADSRNGLGPTLTGDQERGSNRQALSLGAKYLLNAFTQLKFEYRVDRADQAVFLHLADQQFRRSNRLFGSSVVMSF